MDARELLNQVLASGKELAEKGGELAESRLNIPEAGPERDAMLQGLGKGAAAAGALALLLGTRSGRRMTGTVLKVGSLAALGGLGYTAFKKWQEQQAGNGTQTVAENFSNSMADSAADARGRSMLRAMIAAAKADGHIDAKELENIERGIGLLDLDADVADFIRQEAEKPLDVNEVAKAADTPEAAAELWLASRLVIDATNNSEQQYLDSLASALKLAPELVRELEAQVA